MINIDIGQIAKFGWEKRAAVPFSLTTCSYLAEQYYHNFWQILDGRRYTHFLFVVRNSMAVAYHVASEDTAIANYLAVLCESATETPRLWSDELRRMTDEIMKITEKPTEDFLNPRVFSSFELAMSNYLSMYMCVIKAPNSLSERAKESALPVLERARVYSEPTYGAIDMLIRQLAKAICFETPELGFYLLHRELRDSIIQRSPVDTLALSQRKSVCGIYADHGNVYDLCKEDTVALEDLILAVPANTQEIVGKAAVAGHVRGVAKIVLDPHKASVFNPGDILVAEMTRPDYLPFMKNAGAVVTDAGGVLCHAAIVSRELGIPCVIGTKIATKFLKNGDVVEVDANTGVVRKL